MSLGERHIMGRCDFQSDCYFLQVKTVSLPLTTGHVRTVYCGGNFTECSIYKAAKSFGIGRVPRYVSPDDQYELHSRIVENGRWVETMR